MFVVVYKTGSKFEISGNVAQINYSASFLIPNDDLFDHSGLSLISIFLIKSNLKLLKTKTVFTSQSHALFQNETL